MMPTNTVTPGKNGLVRSLGDDRFRQTSINTYLISAQTIEKSKNPEKSKNIEKLSISNNSLVLSVHSNKKRFIQATLTPFFQANSFTPSSSEDHIYYTPTIRETSSIAATPTKPSKPTQQCYNYILPINLATQYPIQASPTNKGDPDWASLPRKLPEQSVITSYFKPVAGRKPDRSPKNVTESVQQTIPCMLNMLSKRQPNSLPTHAQPNTGTSHPPLQPAELSAMDLQEGPHLPLPRSKAPFAAQAAPTTGMLPLTPISHAPANILATSDSSLPSHLQQTLALPNPESATLQRSPQTEAASNSLSCLHSSSTMPNSDVMTTPLTAVELCSVLPTNRMPT
jgi:hypothetical protein